MAQDKPGFGKLNPGQVEALQSALKVLKANDSALLQEVMKGKAQDFIVQEKPGSKAEERDEKLTLSMRNLKKSAAQIPPAALAEAKASIEQAKVHVTSDEQAKNIKVEIETPFGYLEHPSQSGVKRNFLVAHVNSVGELLDTPKVEARAVAESKAK